MELNDFALRDWKLTLEKLGRCRASVKRCCNTHSEKLRLSRNLDIVCSFRTAQEYAHSALQTRYEGAIRRLDDIIVGS